MILVTGGAGFIGSNIVAALRARGHDVAVCDVLGSGDKWQNLRKSMPDAIIEPHELHKILATTKKLGAVVHMGAISSTTETDADLIWRTNVTLSQYLWEWCADRRVPFIYASSAATYGDGAQGFKDHDDADFLKTLRPLNPYGWSKHCFDLWAMDQDSLGAKARPTFWAGLKFFNVYGPNEYHKGGQRSLVPQVVEQVQATGGCKLFKSEHPNYADGGQLRDFVSVNDCVAVVEWLLKEGKTARLVNVGSGTPRSFADLARAVFTAMDKPEKIEFVAMPDKLRAQYQYFTEGKMDKLRHLGYHHKPTSLEDGVTDYVRNYLLKADPYK